MIISLKNLFNEKKKENVVQLLARKEEFCKLYTHVDKMGDPSWINSQCIFAQSSLSIYLSFPPYLLSPSLSLFLSRIAFSGLVHSHARHPRQATPVLTYTGRNTTHMRVYVRTHSPKALQDPRANNSRHKHTLP